MASWKEDEWYVLSIAKVLDITPQQVRDHTWDEIAAQLGASGSYRVAQRMRHQGNPIWYTQEHIRDLRARRRI